MTMEMFGTSPAVLGSTPTTRKHRGRRALTLGIAASAALALFLGGMADTASAAPGDSTNVDVTVDTTLDLTITTPDFALGGAAGAVSTLASAVGYTVTSNDASGYHVTVEAADDVLTGGSLVDGTDTIDVGAMTVAQPGTFPTAAQAIPGPAGDPVVVHSQPTRSASDGDDYLNDYSILIPNVTADVYTVGLNYLVAVGV